MLAGLNPTQREAVAHVDGPLLVLAGAGSGKTRVITHRIAHLIGLGVAPSSILALSFTNKAAREVAERVRVLAGAPAREVTVSTFHSLGLKILREEGKRIGLGAGFTLIGEGERRSIIKQLVREVSPTLDAMAVGDAISMWKNGGYDCAEAARKSTASGTASAEDKVLLTAYELYQTMLKAQRAVDFDDLLLSPLRIFRISPDACYFWSQRFRYILVDEYQDTNQVQFQLLKALSSSHDNLCVVGDDDQSIYGWRGADVELILRFADHFEGAHTVVLEDNYRSTATILDAAHAVVSKLSQRHPKKLRATKEGGEPLIMLECEDERDEAEQIASFIMTERFRTRRPWDHFAVLYRTNGQSRSFEQAFRAQEIPHIVVGGSRFFDRKEVRDLMGYLRAINNPRDDTSLMRIANVPRRGLGHQTLLRLQEHAEREKIPLGSALERADDLPPAARGGVTALVGIMREFRARFRAEGLTSDGLDALITTAKLREDVRSNYESPHVVKKRLELFDEVIEAVDTAAKNFGNGSFVELRSFIDSISLDPPADREEEEGEAVRLMTLHSSKGLEFPVVFLSGMEEGLMPHAPDSAGPEREEEERRLCYVGMTRAKAKLILTHASRRKRRGASRLSLPSRYLMEIPVELTEKGGGEPVRSAEEEQKMASNFFKNIQDIIGDKAGSAGSVGSGGSDDPGGLDGSGGSDGSGDSDD